MTCDRIHRELTAYLDGELEGERGSVVRGHLRECAACRQCATDEAAMRDELRMLPPVDPPASLWAGVQAQLAAAEVADARRPAWKRALARWMPSLPRFAAGGLVVAAAVGVVWWRSQAAPDVTTPGPRLPGAVAMSQEFEADHGTRRRPTMPPGDVTAALQTEAAEQTASYAGAAEELLALATEARGQWTVERTAAFDARIVELRGEIAQAADERARQRVWRRLIRYLQGAVVRDEIAFAGGRP